MLDSGPLRETSGRPVPVSVETFHTLKERQTSTAITDPGRPRARVNLLVGHVIGLAIPTSWTDAVGVSQELYQVPAAAGSASAGRDRAGAEPSRGWMSAEQLSGQEGAGLHRGRHEGSAAKGVDLRQPDSTPPHCIHGSRPPATR